VLTRESWEGADFEELLRDTVEAICVEPDKHFELAGPKLRLRPKLALSFAMVFHELCTNAAKYGALSSNDGRITIMWEILESETGRHLSVLWKELGGSEVKLPTTKGFGSRLINRALSHEFGARVDLAFEPSGVVCRIDTPLA
jgi:two-component sensor histidine kinase